MISTGKGSLLKLMTIIVTGCALFACASNSPSPPNELLSEAEYRIEAAEDAEAGNEAPVALRTAKDQLAAARRSMRDEDYVIATQYLERALANADYAVMKSRSERMQQAADEVQQTIDTLRNELESGQSS